MRSARLAGFIGLFGAWLVFAGCSSPKRAQCGSLSTLINTTAANVEKAQSSPLDPSGLKALAEVLEKSATSAEALKLTVPEVAKYAKSYAAMQRDVAKSAKEMATAGEANDRKGAEAANATMEKLAGTEPALIADFNKFCATD